MKCPQIVQIFQIKENAMMIMLDTSIGIYCQGQNKLSILSLQVLRMTGTQKSIPRNPIQNATEKYNKMVVDK